MSSPESVNAATGPTGTAGGAVATTTTDQSSVLGQFLSAVQSLLGLEASALAKVLGLWTAARAAISTVGSGVAAAATQQTINTVNAQFHGVPLTPPNLADMVVRNVLADDTGAAGTAGSGYPAPRYANIGGRTASQEAAYSGLSEERFAALIADTGESYGILDALRMYNRGQTMSALVKGPNYNTGLPLYVAGANLASTYGITEAELDNVIAYSRVRPEFTADLLKLAKNTLSPADAVELAVKQVVDTATAQSLFEAAGGVGEQFEALVDAAGDSAGIEKAISLYAHGAITKAQLQQILGLSRINPRFYYLYTPGADGTVPANARYLGAYEVGEALANGAITQDQAMTWLLEEGYPQDQATAFATAKVTGQVAKPKEETASQVLKEYQAGLLSETDTTQALTNLGYTAASVPYLLQYATAAAMVSARNSAVSRVRAAFLVGDLTQSQAQADLGSLGIPSAAIQSYMADWAVEAATPHLHLSAAQVGKLLEEGYIDGPTAVQKWQAMGYGANDASLLLYIYPPPAPTGATPPPSGSPGTPAGTGG